MLSVCKCKFTKLTHLLIKIILQAATPPPAPETEKTEQNGAPEGQEQQTNGPADQQNSSSEQQPHPMDVD